MLHAIIMAGGSGTRFWPASRRNLPKQLLSLAGNETMIQATASRIHGLVPPERCLVVTNAGLIAEVKRQLPGAKVVGEPCKRDTAPCVGLAAAMVQAVDADATMLVMPSDHVIRTDEQFQNTIRLAESLIDQDPTRIVTFGIRPTYPAESFGYVERGEMLAGYEGIKVFEVNRFREKPNQATAQQFFDAGTFYWNSGIFVWKASLILDLLRKYEPEMASHLDRIGKSVGTDEFDRMLTEEFTKIIGKSIDYAVMERHDHVVVIEAPFQWDDVGSWQAISRLTEQDGAGNSVRGAHVGIDTKNCVIYGSDDHAIITIDLDDLVVVHTSNATLVAPKKSEERVREAVKELERRGLDAFL